MQGRQSNSHFISGLRISNWLDCSMPVSDGGSREEGRRKASVDAAGREMLAGEITSESAKCTVIFSPHERSSKEQPGSLPLMFL